MAKTWVFVAGAGIGYVLGTRAGRQKYEELVGKARDVMDRPDVKKATQAVKEEANWLYDEGRGLVRDKVRGLRERSQRDEVEAATDVTAMPATTTPSYSNGIGPAVTE
jgi:hypothetical protein